MSSVSRPTASELGLGELFSQIRDAVVVSDAKGAIVLWNPAARAMFGYAPEEVIGKDVSLLVPARFRDRHDAGMRHFRASGHGPLVDSGNLMEIPALCQGGREIIVEMRLSKLTAQGVHVMAIIREVTERVETAAKLDADRRRLSRANDALEAFASVVGHDLKEPVRAVDAYLEALGEHVASAEARDLLGQASSANARLATLLDGLMEWSRASIGGIEPVPLRVDEATHSPACAVRFTRTLEERGGVLKFEGDFAPVLGTTALLCQLFGNLVLNGIVHNPEPNPWVVITQETAPGGMALLRVRDNGPGFPLEVKRRMTASAPRGASLSAGRGGFGLTIAARAAESLGGRLEIAQTESTGGEVRVWLPLAP